MPYSFDTQIKRENTNCYKYDLRQKLFGTDNLIPMWVADMDFKIADEIIEDINSVVNHGIFGYTFHYDALYDSIINWLKKKHNWIIDKNNIHFYHGVVPSINMIIQKFSNPGDGVIVQNPVYFPFFQSIENNNRRVIWNQLKETDGKYYMDFDDLEKSIDKNTKLLLLCNPHNPGGRMWNKDELLQLHSICKKHNIIVVSDEIHSDITFLKKHTPWASLNEDAAQNSFTLTAPSKTFNIAGLGLSVIITENKIFHSIIENSIKENQLHGINLLGLKGFESAYTKGENWLNELLLYLESNIKIIDSAFVNTPINFLPPEATYLAWIDFRKLGLSQEEIVKKLISCGVGLSDGASFGKGGEGFMRLNFACPKSVLVEGLNRIKSAFKLE